MTIGRIADAWYHEMESTFGGLTVVPLENTSGKVSGALVSTELGSVGIYGISGTPQQLVRSPRAVRQSPTESLKVCSMRRGRCTIEQSGRELTVRPGEFALYDTAIPYRLTFQDLWQCEVMTAPSKALKTPLAALDKAKEHSWSAMTGTGAVLTQFISSCASLLAGIVLEDFEPAADRSEGLFRHEIELYIDRRLQDPGLSLESIASSHHVSVRTVQRLFAGTGKGVTGLVRSRRLQATRRDLADPRSAHLTIADVAARWCIHDAQWLAKAFKAEFGMSPSEYRRSSPADTTHTPDARPAL